MDFASVYIERRRERLLWRRWVGGKRCAWKLYWLEEQLIPQKGCDRFTRWFFEQNGIDIGEDEPSVQDRWQTNYKFQKTVERGGLPVTGQVALHVPDGRALCRNDNHPSRTPVRAHAAKTIARCT